MKRSLLLVFACMLFLPQAPSLAAESLDDQLCRFAFGKPYAAIFNKKASERYAAEAEKKGLPNYPRSATKDHNSTQKGAYLTDDEDHLLYDSANGYLFMSFNPAPCGCSGQMTVVAYKKTSGDYVFLENKKMLCISTLEYGLRASAPATELFGQDFGLKRFLKEGFTPAKTGEAIYVLYADLPRHGTRTNIHLEPVPLGLWERSSDSLALNKSLLSKPVQQFKALPEQHGPYFYLTYEDPDTRGELRASFYHAEPVTAFMQKYFTKDDFKNGLPAEKVLRARINKAAANVKDGKLHLEIKVTDFEGSIELPWQKGVEKFLIERIRHFYNVYQYEKNLRFDTMELEWESEKASFSVKGMKKRRQPPKDFFDFLRSANYWHDIC